MSDSSKSSTLFHEVDQARKAFIQAIVRLNSAISSITGLAIDPNHLAEVVADYFNDVDFDYFTELLYRKVEEDWHIIRIATEDRFLLRKEPDNAAAKSAVDALAYCLETLENLNRQPDRVETTGSGRMSFLRQGKTILEYDKIDFENGNETIRARIQKSFKGLCNKGATEPIQSALRKLPGLGSIVADHEREQPLGDESWLIIRTPNNYACHLRNMLQDRFKIPVKLNQAQELLAKFIGVASWQHLVANTGKDLCLEGPFMLLDDENNIVEARYFRRQEDSIWAFAKEMEQIGETEPFFSGPLWRHFLFLAENRDYGITTNKPSVVLPKDRYVSDASRLLNGSGDTAVAVQRYLGVGDEPGKRFLDRLKRDGIPEDRIIFAGRHVYWIELDGISQFETLRGQPIISSLHDDDSQYISATVFKSSFRKDEETDQYLLYYDYSHKDRVHKKAFTQAEVDAIQSIADINIDLY